MRKMSQNRRVIMVGAGPGDPDLITLKGIKALKKADVILYDALASPELLHYASPLCKLVNVGKRRRNHSFSQEEINQLIVFYASRYDCVVRLKGGDPYVFGRGHEELEYAQRRGIEVEVIPGISSAIAAPSSVRIPLTKRGVNESFWVITGTCSSGKISNDIQLASRSSATVIILMGMNNLREILNTFGETRGELEPAAIVQNATSSNQKFIYGTVRSLEQIAIDQNIQSPAVIIIGKVVDDHFVAETLKEKESEYAKVTHRFNSIL